VNPDNIVEQFGADSLRVYEMFMGPFEQAVFWSTDSLVGARRFLERVWRLRLKVKSEKLKVSNDSTEPLLHQTIRKVSEDIEAMRFNTAVSALMILANGLEKEERIARNDFEVLLKLLAPFAPHIAEELYGSLRHKTSIHRALWPVFDAELAQEARVMIVVQVNGKTRGSFEAERGLSDEDARIRAAALPVAQKWLAGKEIRKVIVVPDRLVNIVM
jgi:leucyl-tRNA synthetase